MWKRKDGMKDKEEWAEYDLSWYVGMLICWYVDMLVCWYVWTEYEEGGEYEEGAEYEEEGEYEEGGEYDPIQLVEQVQVWLPTFH